MDLMNKPEPLNLVGNLAVNFALFNREFENYLIASEKSTKKEEVKIAIFLNFIGHQSRQIYYTWETSKQNDLKLVDVVKAFTDYCNPKKNVIYERMKFYKVVQGNDSFDDFLRKLRDVADGCEFDTQVDNMIRDFVVNGLNDEQLRRKLTNMATLKLEDCIKECRIFELEKSRSMELNGVSAELYYVRDGQINDYALNFVVPVPANIMEIAFTWQSLAGRSLPYKINVITSNPEVLPHPYLNITETGEIPQTIETFSVNMKCTGIRPAEVDVIISIEVILNRATHNVTKLVFRRKKICLTYFEQDDNSVNDPMHLETGPPQGGLITLIIGGVLALVLVSLLILIAYCARGHSKGAPNNVGKLVRTSSFQHMQGPPASIYITPTNMGPNYATLPRGNETEHQFHRRISEVTVQRCRVRLSSLLQEGNYGRVYRGSYNEDQEVIVKTVAQHASQTQVSLLLQEGMSLYGASHVGILSVLGVSIEDHQSPFVLYPAPNNTRNLKLFLLDPSSPRSITTIQIVMMSNQLAGALIHLHSHGVIHKDLAARNCVIDDHFVVKLADNSLSRDLFPNDYHCLGDMENRPIKWLALEALQQKSFAEPSDTWAFGILMWELCTFAKQPYAEIDPFEMEHYLRDGYRLAQPYNCPDELFTIMAYCWALLPIERPNFTQLQVCLSDFYNQLTRYV